MATRLTHLARASEQTRERRKPLRRRTDQAHPAAQERRKAPRITERVQVAIRGTAAELRTETVNLSTTGAYCTLDQAMTPMTKLQLQFQLPNGARRVQCEGVVVRVEPVIVNAERGRYHVAIFFTDISERDRASIARFVQQRLSTQ